jgi:exodeoxyribonuclease VII small subunit
MPASKRSAMTSGVPKTFEEKLERIDAIVKELETGRVELDRAIELFKEGKTLARECEAILRNAQEQVDKAMNE